MSDSAITMERMPENKSDDVAQRVTTLSSDRTAKYMSESEYRSAQVVSVQMDPAYNPPPTSLNPAATVSPAGAPASAPPPSPASNSGTSGSAQTE